MAFDEQLADRVRTVFGDDLSVSERRMFGGLAFMVDGNMACGIIGDELMVRVGPDDYEDALREMFAREMDFTGKPMRGLVMVGTEAFESDAGLEDWVLRGAEFAGSLPPK
jgi:hypothetical protein